MEVTTPVKLLVLLEVRAVVQVEMQQVLEDQVPQDKEILEVQQQEPVMHLLLVAAVQVVLVVMDQEPAQVQQMLQMEETEDPVLQVVYQAQQQIMPEVVEVLLLEGLEDQAEPVAVALEVVNRQELPAQATQVVVEVAVEIKTVLP